MADDLKILKSLCWLPEKMTDRFNLSIEEIESLQTNFVLNWLRTQNATNKTIDQEYVKNNWRGTEGNTIQIPKKGSTEEQLINNNISWLEKLLDDPNIFVTTNESSLSRLVGLFGFGRAAPSTSTAVTLREPKNISSLESPLTSMSTLQKLISQLDTSSLIVSFITASAVIDSTFLDQYNAWGKLVSTALMEPNYGTLLKPVVDAISVSDFSSITSVLSTISLPVLSALFNYSQYKHLQTNKLISFVMNTMNHMPELMAIAPLFLRTSNQTLMAFSCLIGLMQLVTNDNIPAFKRVYILIVFMVTMHVSKGIIGGDDDNIILELRDKYNDQINLNFSIVPDSQLTLKDIIPSTDIINGFKNEVSKQKERDLYDTIHLAPNANEELRTIINVCEAYNILVIAFNETESITLQDRGYGVNRPYESIVFLDITSMKFKRVSIKLSIGDDHVVNIDNQAIVMNNMQPLVHEYVWVEIGKKLKYSGTLLQFEGKIGLREFILNETKGQIDPSRVVTQVTELISSDTLYDLDNEMPLDKQKVYNVLKGNDLYFKVDNSFKNGWDHKVIKMYKYLYNMLTVPSNYILKGNIDSINTGDKTPRTSTSQPAQTPIAPKKQGGIRLTNIITQ